MPSLPKGQRHPAELRERAVRMVFEHQDEYPSQWKWTYPGVTDGLVVGIMPGWRSRSRWG